MGSLSVFRFQKTTHGRGFGRASFKYSWKPGEFQSFLGAQAGKPGILLLHSLPRVSPVYEAAARFRRECWPHYLA